MRWAVVVAAALGVLACLFVVLAWWPEWEDNPGWRAPVVDLGILALAAGACLWLALRGPRLAAVPAALLLLVWGWMGTWLYGFLWVPGAAALLGCLIPRPPRPGLSAAAAPAC